MGLAVRASLSRGTLRGMPDTQEPFPYNLPIFRRWHEAVSPNGHLRAWMAAAEISMSNPTKGSLCLSNGLTLENCSPSFIWSSDSRYLAAPQFRFRLGFQLRQRLLIIDTLDRKVYATNAVGYYLQPRTFDEGELLVDVEPFRSQPKTYRLRVPAELCVLEQLKQGWSN